VKKYGIRLMPELYEHLNPMPFEAAAQMEKDLTKDLRAEGVHRHRWNVRSGLVLLTQRRARAPNGYILYVTCRKYMMV
jgi:hypothetical protein